MSIFDDVKKSATRFGQEVSGKANKVADSIRLSNEINAVSKQLDELYERLGREYFSVHSYDCEDQFSVLIGSIREVRDKFERLNARRNTDESDTICPGCGKIVQRNETFCTTCGAKINNTD